MSLTITSVQLKCGHCDNIVTTTKTFWKMPFVRMTCQSCDSHFFQCLYCPPIGGRCAHTSFQFARNHLRKRSHIINLSNYRLSNNVGTLPDPSDTDTSIMVDAEEDDSIISRAGYLQALSHSNTPPTDPEVLATYQHHLEFYGAALDGLGGNYVVEQAITSLGKLRYKIRSHSSTLFMLVLSYFSSRLSKNQCILFSSILSYVKAKAKQESLFVPKGQQDIRTTITEGANSIYTLLPTPSVDEYAGDLVYIPIKETITRLFSKKSQIPNIFLPLAESPHGSSPRGQELLNPILPDIRAASALKLYPLKLILWTDAFQCFNVSVNSDASAHTCTATLGAIDGDHSAAFSFPVWLCKKGTKRDIVEQRLVDEINKLSSDSFPVYHAGIKMIVNVQLKLYTFLCDRPDKCTALHMLQSKFTARFGYAGDLEQVIDHVVCCEQCYTAISSNVEPSTSCTNCSCFDFSRVWYPVGKDFPPSIKPANGLLLMKKMTFPQMTSAVNFCYEQIRDGNWSGVQAKSYLRSEGISTTLSDKCIVNGRFSYLYKNQDQYPDDSEFRNEDKAEHPSDYDYPILPPLWSLSAHIDVGVFIDAYMHLLFLGVQKAISTGLVSRFLTPKRKLSSYITNLNHKLVQVFDIKASYMPIHPSCGADSLTFGGCLSRQWLSICRIMKWLFGHIEMCDSVVENSRSVVPDHFLYIRYLPGQIRMFCYKRGIPIIPDNMSNMRLHVWFMDIMAKPEKSFAHYTDSDILTYMREQNPTELHTVRNPDHVDLRRQVFLSYVKNNMIVPPLITASNSDPDVDYKLMTDVLVLYHSFASGVMGSCSPQYIDRHAKAFLTAVHKLDTALNGDHPRVPMILSKVNFLTLLNVPDCIKRFGSARSLWEGGAMGEGSIPRLKQRIYHMKKGFAKNAINSYLDKESIIDLIEHSIDKLTEKPTSEEGIHEDDALDECLESLMEAGSTIRNDGGDESERPSGLKYSEKDTIHDCEGNVVGFAPHPPRSLDAISSGHPVIEIMILKKTHEMYLLDKPLREFVKIDVGMGPFTILGAQYFPMKYSIAERIGVSDISKDDIICGLLLQHNSMIAYYYAVAMNWTEMTLVSPGVAQFVSPRFASFSYN